MKFSKMFTCLAFESLLLIPALTRETRWFPQPVDHFSQTGRFFLQRYLVDVSRMMPDGPILFFCGNEGDVETFANFSGFLLEVASSLGGIVVYAEHRFYGRSFPFNASSFSRNHMRFLTVEQALADYSNLLQHLLTIWNTRVITFGGSYGGMLSSWMRALYPSLVFAGVASSAPVRFDRVGPSFFHLATEAAESMDPSCPSRVRAGFAAVLAAQWDELRAVFGICTSSINLETLILWARNAFVTTAMGNYPYSSNLFGQGLRPWPLKVACDALSSSTHLGESALEALAAAVNTYYNASGSVLCHNITSEYRACADQTGCGSAESLWGASWDFEACTEIVYFTSTNNRTDMFPPRMWDLTHLQEYCLSTWGVQPLSSWFQAKYAAIIKSSRIVFTNGLLDPWRGGGVLENLSSTLVAVPIPNAAHIYDLAGFHGDDSPAIRVARLQVITLLKQWLADETDGFYV